METEALVQDLSNFQKDHQWWAIEKFYNIKNESLKRAVEGVVKKHETFLKDVAINGEAAAIETIVEKIKQEAPFMFVSFMACFLDYMYKLNTIQKQDVSKELISWYRRQGWDFPTFSFESEPDNNNLSTE
jgi:hypothetical protein